MTGRSNNSTNRRNRNAARENNDEEIVHNVEEPQLQHSESEHSESDSETESPNKYLEDTICTETLPASGSNKENIDSNVQSKSVIEFDPSAYINGESSGEYDITNQIPLPELLKLHVKQLVSGFEFGEATKRQARENMKARKKPEEEDPRPSCSKTLSEAEHKTPHSRKRQRLAEMRSCVNSDKDFPKTCRRVPECLQNHPECKEVWMFMIFKEEAALKLRNPRLFNDFKSVTPRMRAILLDWLMEVAAVYHLRRVTYYLSVDYFDRFLSIRPDIPKSLLQLVGITCLYIAAKVEEIYPPNLSEFSYVCDGACKSKEMVSCELLILNSLGWEVVLTTPSDWLNLYMQLHFKRKDFVRSALNMDFNKDFIFPQYSAYQFTRASQLMDLLSLDPGFLKFGYSVVAAGAMYFIFGEEIALQVSGLTWDQLKPCVDYMEVFYNIIKDSPDPRMVSCLGGPHPEEASRVTNGSTKRLHYGPSNENYSFQTHLASMDYFEKATIFRLATLRKENENPEEVPKEESPEEIPKLDTIASSLVDDIEKIAKEQVTNDDDNLMSFDEIFELILSQEEATKNETE